MHLGLRGRPGADVRAGSCAHVPRAAPVPQALMLRACLGSSLLHPELMTLPALLGPTGPLLPPSPFTVSQAADVGIDRDGLKALTASLAVRRVLRGVYVDAATEDSVLLRCAAARLVTAPHVVVCDRTAAWIWGVDTFDYRELELLPPVETWALRGHARVTRAGCVGGTRDLTPEDFVELHGLLVTTPLRTALDLACRLSARAGLAALDSFVREHGLTNEDFRRGLLRFSRRRGVVQARALCAAADGRSESHGESWVRQAMLEADLPRPDLQVWVDVEGVPTYRLDMGYPKHKVAVEYDGEKFHDTAEARRRDRERRAWLREHGWTVIVVTRHDLTLEAVPGWTRRIADALQLDR